MAKHIERRDQGWCAVLNVPADVQGKLRRKRFRVSLKTHDKRVAECRAPPLIAEWKGEIAMARGEAAVRDDARFWRDALRRATTPEDRLNAEMLMETHILMQGYDNTDPEAQQFYDEAFGTLVRTTEHLDEWIGSLQVKDKTAKMRRTTIGKLGARFPMLKDVSRKEVRRWVTELVAELKPATVQRMMSDCRTYWAYLATIEEVPEDSAPFDRLGLKVKNVSWLPFEPGDVTKLLSGAIAHEDTELADPIRLAMYTGARREELCALPVANVKGDRFAIATAKTLAGVREVPIHRKLAQTMARLVDRSTDGYVLSGLKPNKNGDRGDVLGKRFTRLKKRLGFDNRHTLHSLRGTVITMLERAGVPEGTVQDIVGHERSTLTGSIYSGKSTLEMRRDALNMLVY